MTSMVEHRAKRAESRDRSQAAEQRARRSVVEEVAQRPSRNHLTHDELHVLALLARGHTTDRIATHLNMSERTVRRKTRSACDAVGVETTVEAIVWAVRSRLI
jgi:DNA-binding NarL/FixJ family response regulator